MTNLLTRRHFASTFAALASPLISPASQSAESLIWSEHRIQWQRLDPDGSKYAVIDGDRDRPGELFTYAFWMPDGLWVKAHMHSRQAQVAVLKGTLLLGFGRKMDRAKTLPVRRGEFFIVRANSPHFEGCQGDTLIIGSALGGWKTTELE